MPVEILPPLPFSPAARQKDARADAQALWTRWNSGLSAHTIAARRSDLASFGTHAWRLRDEIAVIRRVDATLASDRATLRALADAWAMHERERGAAQQTIARRWSTLASLVATIGEREREPYDLGAMPRDRPAEIDAARRDAIVHDASESARWSDAVIVGMIGTLGLSDESVARLRCHEIIDLSRACPLPVQRAAERLCRGRPARSHALEGLRRGTAISATGVRRACERWNTTAASLRRLAERERRKEEL